MTIPFATKITAFGSQHSDAGPPSVPNPTPATGASVHSDDDSTAPVDLMAVTNILVPIQEELNDSADEAKYPSPPINTPEATSPAPSIIVRQHAAHVHGFSIIGDRLAQLKISDVRFPLSDTDGTSSNRSPPGSGADDMDSVSVFDVLSDDSNHADESKERPSSLVHPPLNNPVAVALGSPVPNPLIEEYLAFKSDDGLSKIPPIDVLQSSLIEDSASSTKTVFDEDSLDGCNGKGGVLEKSNWAGEVEDQLERICQRLEQLAHDEHQMNPNTSIEDFYVARLVRLLGSDKRAVPVTVTSKPQLDDLLK